MPPNPLRYARPWYCIRSFHGRINWSCLVLSNKKSFGLLWPKLLAIRESTRPFPMPYDMHQGLEYQVRRYRQLLCKSIQKEVTCVVMCCNEYCSRKWWSSSWECQERYILFNNLMEKTRLCPYMESLFPRFVPRRLWVFKRKTDYTKDAITRKNVQAHTHMCSNVNTLEHTCTQN